jgi:phosphate uptake regulator
MEKKIFKLGSTSLAVIIPKKWADKHGIYPECRINVSEGNKGELIITSGQEKQVEVEKFLERSMTPVLISRWIGLHYLNGTKKIKFYYNEGISPVQLDAMEKRIKDDCPGFEITYQSNKEMVIEDFSNMKEMDIAKILSRMHFLISSEFQEAIVGNTKEISAIEKRVNRFYMLGIRYVNVIQPSNYAQYLSVLDSLERISDIMAEISGDVQGIGKDVFSMLKDQLDSSFSGFEGNMDGIEMASNTRLNIKEKMQKRRIDGLQKRLVFEMSNMLSGIAEYGMLKIEQNPRFGNSGASIKSDT